MGAQAQTYKRCVWGNRPKEHGEDFPTDGIFCSSPDVIALSGLKTFSPCPRGVLANLGDGSYCGKCEYFRDKIENPL